jgi:hypothetical protein
MFLFCERGTQWEAKKESKKKEKEKEERHIRICLFPLLSALPTETLSEMGPPVCRVVSCHCHVHRRNGLRQGRVSTFSRFPGSPPWGTASLAKIERRGGPTRLLGERVWRLSTVAPVQRGGHGTAWMIPRDIQFTRSKLHLSNSLALSPPFFRSPHIQNAIHTT